MFLTFFPHSWKLSIYNNIWVEISGVSTPADRYLSSGSVYEDSIIIFGSKFLYDVVFRCYDFIIILQHIHSFVGGTAGPLLGDLWIWNSTIGLWRPVPKKGNFPSPRQGPVSLIRNNTMYMFGGSNFSAPFNDCWSFDVPSLTWTELTCINTPPARYAGGMIFADESTILLFGGGNNEGEKVFYNDTWLWDLRTNTWTNVTTSPSPSPRYQFSFARFRDDQAVLFGGWDGVSKFAYKDVWAFNFTSYTWRQLELTGESDDPSGRTLQGTAMFGCDKMIVTGGRVGNQQQNLVSNQTFTGEFTKEGKWRWTLIDTQNINARFGQIVGIPFHADDQCVSSRRSNITGIQSGLVVDVLGRGASWDVTYIVQGVNIGCNPGYFASNFDNECLPCPLGTYATEAGSHFCTKCVEGLTTKQTGTINQERCNVCVPGHCKNGGKCDVPGKNIAPTCTCNFLLSASDRCGQLSTGAIVLIAAVVGGAFVFTIAFLIRRYIKRISQQVTDLHLASTTFKDKLTQREKEYESAWKIDMAQVKLTRRIAAGGFGEVWRGTWGDRVVAVKKLLSCWTETGRSNALGATQRDANLNFEDEIKFIRKIKHINIVLCYGAGKGDDGCDVLVLEYCSRGSLFELLHDKLLSLPWWRRMDIARDSARGMDYLHKLTPACVHCDVKSLNILISDSWVAKISDFGTLKHVEASANTKRPRAPASDASHSPTASSGGHRGPGTLRWKAPEVLSGEPNSTLSDVYSFGIVLWELYSRRYPFTADKFDATVEEKVRVGGRPDFTESCPQGYRDLVEACWCHDPTMRPAMEEVVRALEIIVETRATDAMLPNMSDGEQSESSEDLAHVLEIAETLRGSAGRARSGSLEIKDAAGAAIGALKRLRQVMESEGSSQDRVRVFDAVTRDYVRKAVSLQSPLAARRVVVNGGAVNETDDEAGEELPLIGHARSTAGRYDT